MLSLTELKEVVEYNPITGIFTRNGKISGSPNKAGYLRISIGKTLYYSHRLAWFYVHGVWPKIIDHINGDKTDNRISNLREATSSQNNINRGPRKGKSSKYRGVYWHSERKFWMARITPEGQPIKYLGIFYTEKEAALAYNKAALTIHGEYARLNLVEDLDDL